MKSKKMLSFILATTMMLASVGCGQNATTQVQGENTTVTQETQEVENATTQTVEEAKAETEVATEVVLTDMIGREVTVTPGSYERVACIGAGALRMYTYIGDVALLCGVEDIDNVTLEERPKMFDQVARPYMLAYQDIFATLPSCGVGGPNAQAAEAEKILACNPDIVISEYEDVEKEDALQEQLGVPVITLKSGKNGVFDEAFFESMKLLGKVFEQEARAEELVSYVQMQREEISSRTASIAEENKPGVYVCGLGNWGTTNHLMTSPNYISFEVANIKNAVTDLENKGIQPIEEEKFVAIGENIDIMFIDAAAVKNIAPLYGEDPTMFDTCKAWNEGEVYLQMAYNAYYTNYETVLINTWYMAKTVYPELFEDIDIIAKTDEVNEMFLGQKLADKIFACPASFGGYQKIDTASFFAK